LAPSLTLGGFFGKNITSKKAGDQEEKLFQAGKVSESGCNENNPMGEKELEKKSHDRRRGKETLWHKKNKEKKKNERREIVPNAHGQRLVGGGHPYRVGFAAKSWGREGKGELRAKKTQTKYEEREESNFQKKTRKVWRKASCHRGGKMGKAARKEQKKRSLTFGGGRLQYKGILSSPMRNPGGAYPMGDSWADRHPISCKEKKKNRKRKKRGEKRRQKLRGRTPVGENYAQGKHMGISNGMKRHLVNN